MDQYLAGFNPKPTIDRQVNSGLLTVFFAFKTCLSAPPNIPAIRTSLD